MSAPKPNVTIRADSVRPGDSVWVSIRQGWMIVGEIKISRGTTCFLMSQHEDEHMWLDCSANVVIKSREKKPMSRRKPVYIVQYAIPHESSIMLGVAATLDGAKSIVQVEYEQQIARHNKKTSDRRRHRQVAPLKWRHELNVIKPREGHFAPMPIWIEDGARYEIWMHEVQP